MGKPILFAVWFSFMALIGPVIAQPPLPADGSFAALNHVYYRPDSSGRASLTDVLHAQQAFKPVSVDIPQFDARHLPHWLRTRIINSATNPESFVAEIDYPFLESVEFYLLNNSGQLLARSQPIGWGSPLKNRPLAHYNPLFQFTLKPGQQAWLYVRATGGKMRLTVPIRLHTAAGFVRADRSQRFFWDCITGMMGMIMLVSFFLFGILNDRIYAIYGLYILASWLYLIGNEGYLLVWFDRPGYGLIPAIDFPILNMYLAIMVSFWLIRTYILSPVIHHRWIQWHYRGCVLAPLVSIFLLITNASDQAIPGGASAVVAGLEPVCYMVPTLLMVGLLVYLTLRRVGPPESAATSPARLYLLAVSPPVLQVLLGFLRERNLISDQFISREGAALTTMMEFIILIGALGYRYKRLADERRQLAIETSRQRQQLLETRLAVQQEALRAAQAQLRVQEERERISRDLHDHVGAQLSVIAANANMPVATTESSALIGTYAREAIQSLRDTVWAIDQSSLTLADFRAKLQQYLNRQQQQHPTCTYTLHIDATDEQVLSSAQALNLFRQVQEAVHNAFKYAHASQLSIHCRTIDNHLTLNVTDNGIGFDPTHTQNGHPHYGLRNLQRRAADLHGECRIESTPGRGTGITVTIPLSY